MCAPDCASRSSTTAASTFNNCSPVKSTLISEFSNGASSKISRTRNSPSAIEFLRMPPPLVTIKTPGFPSLRLASARNPSVTKFPNEPAPIRPFRKSPSNRPITTSSSRTRARYGSSILSMSGSSGMLASIRISVALGLTVIEGPLVLAFVFWLPAGAEGAVLCCANPLDENIPKEKRSSNARQKARMLENLKSFPAEGQLPFVFCIDVKGGACIVCRTTPLIGKRVFPVASRLKSQDCEVCRSLIKNRISTRRPVSGTSCQRNEEEKIGYVVGSNTVGVQQSQS